MGQATNRGHPGLKKHTFFEWAVSIRKTRIQWSKWDNFCWPRSHHIMFSFLHWCPIWQGDVCWSVSPVFFCCIVFFSILCLGVASIWLLFFRLHPYLCSTSSSQPFVFTQHCWLRWSCVVNVLLEKTCGCWIHHMCCWSPIVCRFYPFVISSSTGTNKRLCVSIDEWFSDEHLVLFFCHRGEILHEARDPALLEQSAGNLFTARVFPIEPHATCRAERRSRWDDNSWC